MFANKEICRNIQIWLLRLGRALQCISSDAAYSYTCRVVCLSVFLLQKWALQNDWDILIADLGGASRVPSDSWTWLPQQNAMPLGLVQRTVPIRDSFVQFAELKLTTVNRCSQWRTVLFFSRPQSEGWPHHGRTFSIYPCPLSFWLTLPRRVLSTSWCCPSRPCVAFLACVHLALFLALSLSPGNSLVSSWCDHSILASLLWRCLYFTLFTPALLRTHSFFLFAVYETRRIFLSPFISKASRRVSSFFLRVQLSQPYMLLQATLALSLVVSLNCVNEYLIGAVCRTAAITLLLPQLKMMLSTV